MIAMALAAMLSLGLYGMGLQTRRASEKNRLSTEARCFAKDRLEEIKAAIFENVGKSGSTYTNADSMVSSRGYTITRQPRIVWHAADGSVTNAAEAAYAEVHVDVTYLSPLAPHYKTDTFSTLIRP